MVVACLYQNKWPGVQFYTPSPQKGPKNPNQKLGKCYMKAPIRQALLKTSLFIVHFSKRYLKTSWSIFFMKNQLQTDVFVAFVKSLSSIEYHDLTNIIGPRLSTNFTFVLYRISEWQFAVIFCYTELLFARHSESDRKLISSRTSRSEYLEKFFLEIIRKKFPGRKT